MKKHTRVFLEARGLYEPNMMAEDLLIMCEWCGLRPVVDVNHINPRGNGGSKLKDYPENLIGLCRECHDEFEAKKISKEAMLKKVEKILSNY